MPFKRKQLRHTPPDWVGDGAVFFITICLKDRRADTLLNTEVYPVIRDTTKFYQDNHLWWCDCFILMPDHLHALISFNQRERSMSRTIQSWKRYIQRTTGIEWQRGYFDHRLRNDDAVREKAAYIRNNPVRAGLVKTPEAWPYLWSFR